MQSENRFFDDLAKLVNGAAGTVAGMTREFESNARERAKEWIGGVDFVSREEFDAVKAMAAAAREEVELLKARLDALNARVAAEGRRLDTRRKIILGGLLIDAASKDQRFAGIVSELTHRISRDQDKKPFEGWSLPGEDR